MADDDNPSGRVRLDAAGLVMVRVQRFTRSRIRPALYQDASPAIVRAWAVGGEPVPFEVAVAQTYTEFAIGDAWGRPWGTVWFDVRGTVPDDWDPAEAELVVRLGFSDQLPGFQAEGTAYLPDGTIVKAIEPRNTWVPLPRTGPFHLWIEAAANPLLGLPYEYEATALGDRATAGDEPLYRLEAVDIARRDRTVWELLQDVEALTGLVGVLPRDGMRRAQIVHALDGMVDAMDPDDIAGTARRGREVLAPVLADPAAGSALVVSAVGHAHIDCAWLWPTRETVRKVARTFANVLDLAERYPELVFAASSAQQYAWLKDSQPELFERVRAAVARGVIRPVGGMWVESDTNMPGGEALARQFVLGKRFFLDEFGIESDEVWLPDSFGYSAALPQIIRAAGCRYFLTQKPSWNETNRMPYSSFHWEGIDGSRVFTHFPPAETYNSDLGAADLARAERSFAEKGSAREVLGLFGWGDGGGGPTREMLAAAERKRDLDGSPKVQLSDPHSFFVKAEAELTDASVWLGEIYLELHRGTLISQHRTKHGNRRSEALLHEAELWAATAAVTRGTPYPYEALEAAWRVVLLQQFHDILPGSSIAWVYQEAEANYARVADDLEELIGASLAALTATGADDDQVALAANAGPYAVSGVPALGIAAASAPAAAMPRRDGDRIVLVDDRLRVEVDAHGTLPSVRDLVADREVIPDGLVGGLLQLFRDTPREWDAWDINDEDQRSRRDLTDPESVEIKGDEVVVRHRIGETRIEVGLRLVAGSLDYRFDIDWHESQKLLKLAFPLDLRAERAAAEVQFGHLHRPIHRNTSWDSARFETVAHRWIQVGEPDFGVLIANDVVYGHDVRNAAAPSGRPMTVARLSLLRAPRFPDPTADQGHHDFRVRVRTGAIPEAVAHGYALHLPPRPISGHPVEPLLTVSDPAVVVEAVKLAEDRSGDLVVRLYEAHGTRVRATVTTAFGWSAASATDLLERPIQTEVVRAAERGSAVEIELRPFELSTLRFSAVDGRA